MKKALHLIFKAIAGYIVRYKFLYLGIALCNISCFTFHIIFDFSDSTSNVSAILLVLFFSLSFLFPIILGVMFVASCFIKTTKRIILINIIHSYIGTILIFAAMFYQCSVYGDFMDAVNKKDLYEMQSNIKRLNSPELTYMRVVDKRAFKGIKPRIWSGYDYPAANLVFGRTSNPDSWNSYTDNNFEEIFIEQIERIVKTAPDSGKVIEYQAQNKLSVYLDCLYFSVICIATVGFGDISPSLWYTKLFTGIEILIGLSIFVFAIGMLFSNLNLEDN